MAGLDAAIAEVETGAGDIIVQREEGDAYCAGVVSPGVRNVSGAET